MKFYKDSLHHSFMASVLALQVDLADGWTVNEIDPPQVVGFAYYVSLERDDEPAVKLTRAEILAKARAAKSTKKLEGQIE